MSTSMAGLFVGLLIAIATAAGGFTGFLLAIILAAVGYVVGRQLEGRIDVGDLLKSRRN